MADEITKIEEQQETDYIAAITELKEQSVPKEQYAKLKEENAKLLRSLINGEEIEGIDQTPAPDVSELRKQLFSGEAQLNNLEYVTRVLELRNQLILEGKRDPFLPYGEKIAPTAEDVEGANRVAKILQECVDYADGDSTIFTNELQRVMIDTAPARAAKKK